jgi:hypothetical protein
VGLPDIAPPEVMAKTITIRGGDLNVRGIKNLEWVQLIQRFRDIKKLIDGTGMNIVDVYESTSDGLIPAVIATGMGNCGDKATEDLILERLSEAEQFAIFESIMELGSAEKAEARRKVNPLLESPGTNKPGTANGSLEPIPQMISPQPFL